MKNTTISELRERTGLSQSQFAKRFHLSIRAVQSWEQGQRNTPEHVLYMIQTILDYEEELKQYSSGV
jgi:putative transcriptional regulator